MTIGLVVSDGDRGFESHPGRVLCDEHTSIYFAFGSNLVTIVQALL